MKVRSFIWLFLLACSSASAQSAFDALFVLPDTVKAFTLENFYASILNFHPVVRQTELLPETARQQLRLARGAFDPKLESQFSNKEFRNTEYYNTWMAGLSIPTWFPVDPKIGIERNRGTYLNNENFVPAADNFRQIFAGVSLPIGRGLFTDERRAALQQAKIFTEIAEADQIRMINKILLDAAKDYWQWYYAYYNYRLLNRNADIAREIFRRVKLDHDLGEASAIDTVQAKITLQQRLVEQQEALIDFLNTGIQISNYLWDDAGNPLDLGGQVTPLMSPADGQILAVQTLQNLTQLARENHPDLLRINLRLEQLDVERRLAAEWLKPKVDLSYTFLNTPFTPGGEGRAPQLLNDYKFGVDFSIPIFLRRERARLAQTRLRILGTTLERTQLERDIVNQIEATFNQLVNTNLILRQQREVADNYERLLQAELMNLANGESDLFRINVQQERLIQSQSKLLKLMSEYEKMKATIYWAAGLRNLRYGD